LSSGDLPPVARRLPITAAGRQAPLQLGMTEQDVYGEDENG
jgi:hypothetical protein